MNSKYSLSVTGASIFIILITIFSKGLGFLREMVFAGIFGLGADYDLYLVASVLPFTICTILLYLGQNYFIPIYNKFLKTNNEKEILFVNYNLIVFFIMGLVLAFTLYFFKNLIIGLYLANSKEIIKQQAAIIFSIYLISIPIYSVISILSAYFQQKLNFVTPAFSQLLLNFCIILLVPIFHNELGILIIPISFVLGALVQLLILLRKSKIINFKLKDIFYFNNILSHISGSLIIIVFIESISQLFMIADRYFVFKVDRGGIAALNYAQNIFMLPISIIGISIYTAIFPKLTEIIHHNMNKELERFLIKSIRLFLLVFIPTTIIFVFYNQVIIELVYERGKFGFKDTIITGQVLSYLSISLFVCALYGIFNKLFYSSGMIKPLLLITVISCMIKIFMNWILVNYIRQNGLALSSSITYLFLLTSSILIIQNRIKIKVFKITIINILYMLFNGLLSYYIIAIIMKIIHVNVQVYEICQIILFVIIFYFNLVLIDFVSWSKIKLFALQPNALSNVKLILKDL